MGHGTKKKTVNTMHEVLADAQRPRPRLTLPTESAPRGALRRAAERQRCTTRHTAALTAARQLPDAPRAQPPALIQQERTPLFPHFLLALTLRHALPALLPCPANAIGNTAVHEIDSRFSVVDKKGKETSVGYRNESSDLLTALPAASLNMPKPTWKNSAFPAAPAATTRPFLSVVTRLSRTQSHADLVLCVL